MKPRLRDMAAASLAAVGLLSPFPVLADAVVVDLCRATQSCDMAGVCQPSAFSFRFLVEEDADGTQRDVFDLPGAAPIDATSEPSTQGFTFSDAKHVYTFLYLLNDSFPDGDDPEFALLVADLNGRIDAVTLYTGTCEAEQ
jgi:hypothetical protein